jgi:hypothetical protein
MIGRRQLRLTWQWFDPPLVAIEADARRVTLFLQLITTIEILW